MKKAILILPLALYLSCTPVAYHDYDRDVVVDDLLDLKSFVEEDLFNQRIDSTTAETYTFLIDDLLKNIHK